MKDSKTKNELTIKEHQSNPEVKAAWAQDLICLSHLRWNFVYQRPQHLISRFAREQRVFFVEEPVIDYGPSRLVVNQDQESGVWLAVPHLDKKLSKEEGREAHIAQIDQMLADFKIERYILWYYTPMAMGYTQHLQPDLIVYDCMDELSAFKSAPPKLKEYEAELLRRADLVFTGGQSLYEVKREKHPNVHAFPSSIDVAHFAQARQPLFDPVDQAGIPHPRLGFFGVIDERMDLDLLAGIADMRPNWHMILIGPVAKVDPLKLPRRYNIHYLGIKPYKELPTYLAGWDAALLPFAQNESTRFISPTKTPEYLAGGRPVISTPIRDVIRPYGDKKLVWIAEGVEEFVKACESALAMNGSKAEWLQQVDEILKPNSWDRTWESMKLVIQAELKQKGFMPVKISSLEDEFFASSTAHVRPVFGESRLESPEVHHNHNDSKGVYDYLIVGAGFAGSVLAERLACGSGKKVLLIDRRPHIGGNAYDYYNEYGILIHKYGPHIFHTNSREVFGYLSRFTEWRTYEHRVKASVDGHLLPMPINLDTINELYGLKLSSFDLEKFFESVAEKREVIRTSEDVVVNKIGRALYEKFFRNYTRKQWNLDPSELDASVTARVPIRNNRDDRYFTDTYQSMPLHGYTRMFENILDHRNIHIMLKTDYQDVVGYVAYRDLIFTGPVDEFFDYRYGKLPYRSLQFKFETLDERQHQPIAVINYPNEHLYTRVTEFKHLTGQDHEKTTLVYEYPCSEGDPYYPVPQIENAELYKQYKALAEKTRGVHFCGRLGTYRYYNMDQVTAQALTLYARINGISRSESINRYTSDSYSMDMPCSLMANLDTGE